MTSGSEFLLKGKSVLVTGASGDIGQAIVTQCLSAGAYVFAAGRDETRLGKLVEDWGEKSCALIYDITDERAVKENFRVIQKKQMQSDVGPLFGLINNAGVMHEASLSVSSMDKLKEQLNVNFLAPYQHMQLAARLMARQRSGSIINMVSQVSELGSSGMSAYGASKAALTGATRSLAKELAPIGIRVNAVAPGFIDTALTAHYDDSARAKINARTAMNRPGKAAEVASAVLFLLTQRASFTTGHILPVDGMFCP